LDHCIATACNQHREDTASWNVASARGPLSEEHGFEHVRLVWSYLHGNNDQFPGQDTKLHESGKAFTRVTSEDSMMTRNRDDIAPIIQAIDNADIKLDHVYKYNV
jgi:hypothetical protein